MDHGEFEIINKIYFPEQMIAEGLVYDFAIMRENKR